MMLLVWLHAYNSGTIVETLSGVKVYWIALGVIMLLVVVARLAFQFGFFKLKAKVLSHKAVASDIFELHVQLPRAVSYQHGQFIYLQAKRGGENHPFTILSYDAETQQMKIAYKAVGRYTKSLAAMKEELKTVFIDGPYGEFTAEITPHQTVICIAGGIGLAPFFQLLTLFGKTNAKLVYLTQHQEDTPYLEILEKKLKSDLLCVFSRDQEEKTSQRGAQFVSGTRLSAQVLASFLPEGRENLHYYLCGSKSVIQWSKNLLLSMGGGLSQIHRELFEM